MQAHVNTYRCSLGLTTEEAWKLQLPVAMNIPNTRSQLKMQNSTKSSISSSQVWDRLSPQWAWNFFQCQQNTQWRENVSKKKKEFKTTKHRTYLERFPTDQTGNTRIIEINNANALLLNATEYKCESIAHADIHKWMKIWWMQLSPFSRM